VDFFPPGLDRRDRLPSQCPGTDRNTQKCCELLKWTKYTKIYWIWDSETLFRGIGMVDMETKSVNGTAEMEKNRTNWKKMGLRHLKYLKYMV
jgi:hypothetical protein